MSTAITNAITPSFKRLLLPIAVVVAALNLLSGLAFIAVVNRPVFDEQYNLPEAQRYATGNSWITSIKAQTDSPGPTSFIWMAEAIKLIPRSPLAAARLSVWASWLLLSSGLIVFAKLSKTPALWYIVLLSALVFPHSETSTAVVLTEGPALLFALLGSFCWLTSYAEELTSGGSIAKCLLGAFFIGLSITCRQFYLALLPSMMILILYRYFCDRSRVDSRWLAVNLISFLLATLPVVFLMVIWGGLSSPLSRGVWQTTVGVNTVRPVVAAFYVFLYLFPLTFSWIGAVSIRRLSFAFAIGLISASVLTPVRNIFLQAGPLEAALHPLIRRGYPHPLAFFVITTLIIGNAAIVAVFLGDERKNVFRSPLPLFSICFVIFFVLEQSGIGSGPGFYERYILQVFPFLAVAALSLRSRLLETPELFTFSVLWIFSQAMLWRYAFVA